MLNLLLAPIMALANRFRGGGFVHTGRTQFVRLSFAAAFTFCASVVVSAPMWVFVATFWLAWAAWLTGHNEHQDIGRLPPGYGKDGEPNEVLTFFLPVYDMQDPLWYRELVDVAGMSWIGFVRMGLSALPLVFFDMYALILLVAGALQGPAYWLAWRLWPDTGKQHWFSNPEGSVHNAEYGELLWGLVIGLAFVCIGAVNG